MPVALPLRIVGIPGGYCIEDAKGLRFAYTYGEDEPGRRNAAGLMDKAEALKITQAIARALTDAVR